MKKILFLISMCICLCSGVSAITWTSESDHYVSYDGTNWYYMWNATGTHNITFSNASLGYGWYTIVGGGGGGGISTATGGSGNGGGGAGGFLNGSASISNNTLYYITVGAGGRTGNSASFVGYNGGNSSFGNATIYTAIGGGGGAGTGSGNGTGVSGGSGGGSNYGYPAGNGTSGQGYAGGIGTTSSHYGGGGGGGAGAIGSAGTASSGGSGGAGAYSNITGTNTQYGGGGGGSIYGGSSGGAGGSGGGGAGGLSPTSGSAGTNDLGGGGGSSSGVSLPTGNGGSGIVIVRFVPDAVVTPIAVISATPLVGHAPLSVAFTGSSINNPTSWFWDFGDGNFTGNTTQSPTHLYTQKGTYTVTLSVGNSHGNNTLSKSNYITITNASELYASFALSSTSGITPLSVQFTDTSTNYNATPDQWLWKFGDGNTSSSQNPLYTYDYAGTYHANLTVTNTSFPLSNTTASQTITTHGPSGFNQQDIYMSALYTLTITVTDSSTSAVLANVSVADSTTGTSGTTNENGIVVFTNQPFGTITGSLTKDGYTSKTFSIAVTNDTSTSIAMSPTSSSSTSVWYTPKQVGISVVRYNPAGKKVVNATISLAAIASTLQADSQLQTLYGIDAEVANQMMNGTLLMTGTTGDDGATAFTVLSSIKYQAKVTDPVDGKMYTTTINPAQDPYTIWIGTSAITVTNTSYSTTNNTALYTTQPNASYVMLNLRYQDTSNSTTNVIFYVVAASNMTTIYSVDLGNPGINAVYANHTHKNTRGSGFYYYYNATRSG